MEDKKNYESTKQRLTEDSECVGPLIVGDSIIGFVDEVNGHGAVEEPSFIPTRHELIQLAKYWIERRLDVYFWWFLYEASGSTEIRVEPFARMRIGRIARIVGEAEIEKVREEVYKKFSADVNPVLWRMFLAGEEPDRDERGFPIIPADPANSEPTS